MTWLIPNKEKGERPQSDLTVTLEGSLLCSCFFHRRRFCALSMLWENPSDLELFSRPIGLASGKFWITSEGMFCLLPLHSAKGEKGFFFFPPPANSLEAVNKFPLHLVSLATSLPWVIYSLVSEKEYHLKYFISIQKLARRKKRVSSLILLLVNMLHLLLVANSNTEIPRRAVSTARNGCAFRDC